MVSKIRKYNAETAIPDDAYGLFQSSDLSILLLEGTFPHVIPLISHSLRITDQAESTPTTSPLVFWNPRASQLEMREIERTRTYRMNVKFEVGIPPYTSSRMLELAKAGLRKDLIDYVPSADYSKRLATIYSPETGYKEPIRSEDQHMGGTDPSAARRGYTTGAQAPTLTEVHGLLVSSVNTMSNGIHALAWLNPDYDGGQLESPQDIIIGGEQIGGSADEILSVLSSDDARFDTNTDIATALPASSIITGILQLGSKTVVTFADNIDPTTATSGGIAVYANGLVTEALLSAASVAEPMYAIAYDKNSERFIAVGKGGKTYAGKKTSLTTLSDLSSAATTSNMLDIAVRNGIGYIACEDGNAFTLSGSVFTDITTAVVGALAPSALNSVAYPGHQHLAFGGASGFYSETLDGGDNWFPEFINSGAGNINKIVGETWRTFVGVDGVLLERSVITPGEGDVPEEFEWRELELTGDSGFTGNITDMALLQWMDGPNVLAIVTDAGEVGYAKPGVMQY